MVEGSRGSHIQYRNNHDFAINTQYDLTPFPTDPSPSTLGTSLQQVNGVRLDVITVLHNFSLPLSHSVPVLPSHRQVQQIPDRCVKSTLISGCMVNGW